MKTAIVIPARYASTRLPAKALLDETGKPLIQHVYEQACQSKLADKVVIATDDERIMAAINSFGGHGVMTATNHPNGTSRIHEAVEKALSDYDIIINVQGDEPELEPETIDHLIDVFAASNAFAGTLVAPFDELANPHSPDVVKAVLGKKQQSQNGRDYFDALYFSRSLVPYPRDEAGKVTNNADFFMHIGMYAYTPESLKVYAGLPEGRLEQIEKLEQLRILENGHRMIAGIVSHAAKGIDTAENYKDFLKRWQSKN